MTVYKMGKQHTLKNYRVTLKNPKSKQLSILPKINRDNKQGWQIQQISESWLNLLKARATQTSRKIIVSNYKQE